MVEVEIKVSVKERNLLEEKLMQSGFVKGDLLKESDFYFDSDFHKIKENGMALRIRSCENLTANSVENFMTFKGPKMDQISMTRKELEMQIESAEIGKEIFTSLGYTLVRPVIKRRQYFHRDTITACLDQVEDLGDFMELEIVVSQEAEKDAALSGIFTLLSEVGYEVGDVINTSYLSMLQRK